MTDLSFATPRGVQDTTGIDKSAHERLLLLADFSIAPKGVFNSAVSHAVFKTVPSTSVVRPVAITVNGTNLSANCLFSDYSLARSNLCRRAIRGRHQVRLRMAASPVWS